MINAFAAAIDVLFADPNIASEALYTPVEGKPKAVRVVARRPDTITGWGAARIVAATAVFDVRLADIGDPAVGDVLTVNGRSYVVQAEPTQNELELVWALDARPQ